MCGIAGIIINNESFRDNNIDLLDIIEGMLKEVKHRGPDYTSYIGFSLSNGKTIRRREDKSVLKPPGVVIGHARLSILDLTPSGHQPMGDENKRFWIVHNGEVYNYIEIRNELKRLGYGFSTGTDTEVILKAYVEWGKDSVKKFNGMWAFCIYDSYLRKIFCSRDRFGIKPLYYYWMPGIFIFASEVKQLLKTPWVHRDIDFKTILDLVLWNLENHTYETFIKEIRMFPQGTYFEVPINELTNPPKFTKFWHLKPFRFRNEKEAIKKFRFLIEESVKLRLRSDVPVGITLSGGLDSSSVTSLVGKGETGNSDNIVAFNVDYGIRGFTEKIYAETVAKEAKIKLVTLTPTFEDLKSDWNNFIWYMEQPVPSLSYFSNYEIYKLIHDHEIRVVLTGQGGDELLLGYDRYRAFLNLFLLKKGEVWSALKNIKETHQSGSMDLKRQLSLFVYFSLPLLRKLLRLKIVKPFLKSEFLKKFELNDKYLYESSKHSDWKEMQIKETFYFQLPHLLHHEDHMSMAHSVETRLPFLDHRLLELIQGVEYNLLFRNGYTKFILREALKDILPAKVRLRKDKMGFDTPTGMLIRKNKGLFLPLLERNIDDPIFDIRRVINFFDDERLNERLLCTIVSYLTWKELFNIKVHYD